MQVKMTLGQVAYKCYRDRTGGVSLATGQPIPEWSALPEAIQDAWQAAARGVTDNVCLMLVSLLARLDVLTPLNPDTLGKLFVPPTPPAPAKPTPAPEVDEELALWLAWDGDGQAGLFQGEPFPVLQSTEAMSLAYVPGSAAGLDQRKVFIGNLIPNLTGTAGEKCRVKLVRVES